MRKKYLLFVLSLSFLSLIAQENETKKSKHFASFRAGYGIPVAKSQVGSPRTEVGQTFLTTVENNAGDVVSSVENNSFGTRGAGLNFSLEYGYNITDNFTFEIGLTYLQTLGLTDAFTDRSTTNGSVVYKATQTSLTTMLRVTPMVGVYANENLLIRPYAKFGLIVPVAGSTFARLNIEDNIGSGFESLLPVISPETVANSERLIDFINNASGGAFEIPSAIPTITEIEAVTSGSFSVGFMGRFGAEYKINKKSSRGLKLFAEMEIQMLTVKSRQSNITSFFSTINSDAVAAIVSNEQILASAGIDNFQTEFTENDIPEILLTTNYLDEINETSNSSFDVNNPNYDRDKAFDQLSFRDSYNAFAFLIGVKYNF